MNPGQQKFHSFIMERVEDENRGEAEKLLSESFRKQDERTFDQQYLASFIPRMKSLLKPEYVEEVDIIMKEFGSKLAR